MSGKKHFWNGLSSATALFLLISISRDFYLPWQRVIFANSDFESGTLENWMPTGRAFGQQPVFGDNPTARGRGGAWPKGSFWVGTFEDRRAESMPAGKFQGDEPQGRLTSVEFTIEEGRIIFLLGAGTNSAETGVALEVNGSRVLFQSGAGVVRETERMASIVWDVSSWLGQRARIVVVDESSGGWGHINVDEFRYG